MRIYITKRISTKSGKQYTALILNKNNKEYFLSFDTMLMLRISNMTLAEFEDLSVDEVIEIM